MSDRLKQLQGFLDASPGDSFVLFAIAKEYEKLNRSTEALEQYLVLKSNDPEYVGLYYHLGKWYEKEEQYQKAIETYTEGMKIAKNQGDQHSLNELAGARLGLVDDDE